MSKLSKEEIEKRGRRMQKEALKSVAKTEQLNLRMEAINIERLYILARKKKTPVGTLVREWIVERLDLEDSPAHYDAQLFTNAIETILKMLPDPIKNAIINNSIQHEPTTEGGNKRQSVNGRRKT
jgi:hypothetical protein